MAKEDIIRNKMQSFQNTGVRHSKTQNQKRNKKKFSESSKRNEKTQQIEKKIRSNMHVITIKANGLNLPIKRQKLHLCGL